MKILKNKLTKNFSSKQGYRELAVSDEELKKLLDRMKAASDEKKKSVLSDLQPLLTYTNIAIDECDFGTGIELGLNILAYGVDDLNLTAMRFLANCYRLIDRAEFAKIAEAHMKNRKKTVNLSIL